MSLLAKAIFLTGCLSAAWVFDCTVPPGAAQSASLAAGIAAIRQTAHVVIALGDMPFLLPADFVALLALGSDQPAMVWHRGHPRLPGDFPGKLV
ncbi:MAG: NTP transferase domain-containing protein [Paracoccus sp. (in: a-proteobacteria)]|nr:NTP transferase domain-containing protein [Paracoccus sp. (in: a-proteobacteria)]